MLVIDRDVYEAATALVAEYGRAALAEALGRAEAGRRADNPFRCARWHRVRRAIAMFDDPNPRATRH